MLCNIIRENKQKFVHLCICFFLSLSSFNFVINRAGLRAVLSEKFLEVFGWFETELESVQKIYESQKVGQE